jgi:hypothetical protein
MKVENPMVLGPVNPGVEDVEYCAQCQEKDATHYSKILKLYFCHPACMDYYMNGTEACLCGHPESDHNNAASCSGENCTCKAYR